MPHPATRSSRQFLLALALFAACAPVREPPAAGSTAPLAVPQPWSSDRPIRFLVLGDTQRPGAGQPANDRERQAIYGRVAAALADSTADFLFHVGDLIDHGSKASDWRDQFDALFWDHLSSPLRQRFFAVPGNHEYKGDMLQYGGGGLGPYFERFRHLENRRYYHFFQGRACFVAMDSGRNGIAKVLFGERWQNGLEEQISWLRETLFPDLRRQVAAGELEVLILFFHKPAFTTPVQRRNRQSCEVLELFDRLNRELGHPLQIISFAGHIHTFSHIPLDLKGDGANPIHQFTMGGGGATQRGGVYFGRVKQVEDLDLYRLGKYEELATDAKAGVDQLLFDQLRADSTHFGYLEVVLDDPLRVIYQRFDQATGSFHPDYVYTPPDRKGR